MVRAHHSALFAVATAAIGRIHIILLPLWPDLIASMPREAEPSNNERAFILEALQQNIRLDGRALDAFRNIELELGDEYGVAD
ncbi:MAG: hypothetical protein Q9211_007117, partial [Gyalolechia sp. 1 TL-2023]